MHYRWERQLPTDDSQKATRCHREKATWPNQQFSLGIEALGAFRLRETGISETWKGWNFATNRRSPQILAFKRYVNLKTLKVKEYVSTHVECVPKVFPTLRCGLAYKLKTKISHKRGTIRSMYTQNLLIRNVSTPLNKWIAFWLNILFPTEIRMQSEKCNDGGW